ncbi:MAG: IMP cyclohydrolase [Oscillospiraceae bacterium]|nr:IMP cyclohydrolase [Oscillospiraceae bacterium]
MNIIDMNAYLRDHAYPGRGILLGRSADNKSAVIAYFIMGRSANSRNRVFTPVAEDKGIQTEAADPAKLEDPSLIIYHPVRYVASTGDTVVTNGDQTDTVRDGILEGKAFAQSLRQRCFEPDPPNYTPRISGLVHPDGSFALSILKSADGNPDCNNRYFYGYDAPLAGEGRFIHTYQANENPLPSFEGEPRRVAISAPDAKALAKELWENLNEDNKVSLFVRYIDLDTGKTDDVIVNKFEKV